MPLEIDISVLCISFKGIHWSLCPLGLEEGHKNCMRSCS